MNTLKKVLAVGALVGFTSVAAQAADNNQAAVAALAELAKYQQQETTVNDRLKAFDTLDFEVFTGQKWDRLHESHAENIVVHWPDGHSTTGLDVHINDLKAFFVYAPDTRIETHPVRIGQGEWTGVVGVIEGTFSKPMPIGDGQFIQPTNQPTSLTS